VGLLDDRSVAAGWNNSIHPQVFHYLPMVVPAVPEGAVCEFQSWQRLVAVWALNWIGFVFFIDTTESILDNGPGISQELNQREEIGMANTRARLDKYYGSAQSFRYSNRVAGGLRVDIRFPFRVSKRVHEAGERDDVANANCR